MAIDFKKTEKELHQPKGVVMQKLKALVQKYPLAAFFMLAYLGSWIGWTPWWLSATGIGVLPYTLPLEAIAGINQVGLFAGPFASALLVTRIVSGKQGLKKFTNRITQWRGPATLYVLALLGIPASIVLGCIIASGGVVALSGAAITSLITTYFIYILGGPLQEEPGWRGFALPRLQEKMHPLASALVLGIIHCFWHTPLFFTREWDTPRGDVWQFAAYLVLVVSLSVVMSWVANKSRGGMVLSILAHNGINWGLFAAALFIGTDINSLLPAAVGLTVLALIAIIATKGQLGYQKEENRRYI
ncbi:CAAX amino protease [Spirochaetia bacterium]|nr:CAAX amino protease [Spirochaetia bacterium]